MFKRRKFSMVCSSRRVVALEKEAAPVKSFSSFISFILYARCVCVIVYHIKSSDAALSDEKRRVLFVGTRGACPQPQRTILASVRPTVRPSSVRPFIRFSVWKCQPVGIPPPIPPCDLVSLSLSLSHTLPHWLTCCRIPISTDERRERLPSSAFVHSF